MRLILTAALLTGGCSVFTPPQPVSLTAFKSGPMIEGVVKAPDGVPADTMVALLDPQDAFVRQLGKPVVTATDRSGAYRFQNGFPRDVPVFVAAMLTGNRRVTGFAVTTDGTSRLNLGVASTLVAEFLRDQARRDGRSLADLDPKALADLTATTQALLDTGDVATPSLEVAAIPAMNRAYAIAVGTDVGGLGDAWAALLGRRVLALVTVAGTGDAGPAGDGLKGPAAELYRPRSVVADRAGHLFVADTGNRRVRRIDGKTQVVTAYAGTGRAAFGGDGGGAPDAHLNEPRALALDAGGHLFIADMLNGRIRRVDGQTGVIETFAGNPVPDGVGGWLAVHAGDGGQAKLGRFYAPRSLAFGPAGDLYVTDSERDSAVHTIRKIDVKSGLLSTVVGVPDAEGAFTGDGGRPDAARLSYPNQIAFDAQGRLLIADADNHCVRRADLAGGSITTIAGIGGQPGNDADGKPATQTRLDTPVGVAAGPDGRVYIAERLAGRIRLLETDGKLRTLAGGGSDWRDGDARAVKLGEPHDLFLEATGDLLIADARGSRLRRLVLRHGL